MASSNIVAFEPTGTAATFAVHSKSADMRSDLVEKASQVITDPPLLINVVSKRVRQLNTGRSPLVQVTPRMGAADIALLEIIEGKVMVDENGNGEVLAKKATKKKAAKKKAAKKS